MLARAEPLVVPGAFDSASAVLVQRAGFDTVYLSGFGVSASALGRPDIGLTTMTEMVDAARRMVQAVDIPVIADADTGYGNALNVVRTVYEYERAGVAALQIEDQVAPKRCGHMSGKQVVDAAEAEARIRAAVSARTDPDLIVVARTDAAQVHGIAEAIERARRFADAGADVLFVEAPSRIEDVRRVARELKDHCLLFNWVEGGRTEHLTFAEVADLGFRLVLFPVSTLLAATKGVQSVLATLHAQSSTDTAMERMAGFEEMSELLGLGEIRSIGESFAVD